jgi:hypothetical protein
MENPMHRSAGVMCLVTLSALVAGCAPSLESKLVGRWRLDTQSIDLKKAMEQQIQEKTEGNEAAAAMAEAFSGMMQAMLDSVEIKVEMDFRPDHTLQSKAAVSMFGQSQEKTQAGTWKVEAVGENQLTVTVTAEGKTKTINLKFLDDNTFVATGNVPGAGNQQAKFVRVPQGA